MVFDEFPLDFGSGIRGAFVGFHPDRELNPQYAGVDDTDRYGLMHQHPDQRDPAQVHTSMLIFDVEQARLRDPDRDKWTVESWEPLTIAPSVHCNPAKGGCGLHGYIRDGLWVPC